MLGISEVLLTHRCWRLVWKLKKTDPEGTSNMRTHTKCCPSNVEHTDSPPLNSHDWDAMFRKVQCSEAKLVRRFINDASGVICIIYRSLQEMGVDAHVGSRLLH